MPKCYQLVGVPGSGKTTWASKQNWSLLCANISTDKWVEIYADQVGKTYSEVFENFMPIAVDIMCKEVEVARSFNRDIIWDQTSTTIKSRMKKFKMLPDYEHIAVVFKTPTEHDLKLRLSNRPGKEIPWSVITSMISQFESPTQEEGFTEIWYVT